MPKKITVVEETVNEKEAVEIKPLKGIAKWKIVGMHPAFPPIITAAVATAALLAVIAFIPRESDSPTDEELDEMIAEIVEN